VVEAAPAGSPSSSKARGAIAGTLYLRQISEGSFERGYTSAILTVVSTLRRGLPGSGSKSFVEKWRATNMIRARRGSASSRRRPQDRRDHVVLDVTTGKEFRPGWPASHHQAGVGPETAAIAAPMDPGGIRRPGGSGAHVPEDPLRATVRVINGGESGWDRLR